MAPLNFELKPGTGTVSTTGGDLTISNVVISANSISFTITVNSILNSDVITISGIEVRGLTTPSSPSDIERIAATLSGIDAIVNGDDPGGTVNHGTLTSDLLAPTDITTGPTGAIYCQNGTATALSVTATGTGTLTYKWFSNTVNNNTSGTAVGGATSSSFTPPTVTAGTTYYYVEVTGTCGTIASNTAQVIVNASTDITTDPTGAIYCQNGTATALSVTATGTGTLTYQWFSNTVNNNTSGTAEGGATSSSFTPPTVTAGTTYYYVEVTGTCGTIASNTAQVIVNASTDITTDPTGAIYCQNGTATALSVTATGTGTLTYQWFSNTVNNNTSGTTVAATLSSFTPPTVTAGTTYYYVEVTGTCGTIASNTSNITVTATNTAGTPSSSPTVCINTAITPSITHTTTGATGISSSGVSGANGLPAGVSATWAGNTITISGTPTASGTFAYSILLTGGCGTVNATGTIIVTANNTVTAGSTKHFASAQQSHQVLLIQQQEQPVFQTVAYQERTDYRQAYLLHGQPIQLRSAERRRPQEHLPTVFY